MNNTNSTADEAQAPPQKRKWRDLGPRLASAALMLTVTIFVVWLGGIWFALLVAAAFAWVVREWEKMISAKPLTGSGYVLMGLIALVPLATAIAGIGTGVLVAFAGVLAALFLSQQNRGWRLGGFAFFSFVVIALVSIRGVSSPGFAACFFLGTTVWMTDTGAFFSGRFFGGAKLNPEISPAKTWSGAIGGLVVGSLSGLLIWVIVSDSAWWIGSSIAVVVSLSGQIGDLSQSAIKRHFRIKDSGGSIPGHGGLMDRLDSLTFGALIIFCIGAMHMGPQMVARGIMIW